MALTLVLACDETYGIGKENGLLYHFKQDLKRFKALTSGKTLVMGRRTWESLPGKLPNRTHIVLSRIPVEGADETVHSREDVLELAQAQDIWIIGGSQIYEMFWKQASRIYLTLIHSQRAADTHVEFLAPLVEKQAPSSVERVIDVDTLSGQEYALSFICYDLS